MQELYWILVYWDDVDADYLRFYGVDLETEIDSMESARFFKRATRLLSYEGALVATAQKQAEEAKQKLPAHARDAQIVPEKVLASDDLGPIIDFK